MTHTTRHLGGNIVVRCYWPDNTKDTLHVVGNEHTLAELIDFAEAFFEDRYDPEKINIRFEKIHTNAIDYDMYDPADWTDFTIISMEYQ